MSASLPGKVRAARPLVHCITNDVTMEWVARGLLAAGARPVMAHDRSEAAAVAASADALVLNIGTWTPARHEAMLAAGRAANEAGVPVILDPVGAGGVTTRTRAALELLEAVKVTAVRGNAGEVLGLAGRSGLTRGVDATIRAGQHVQRAAGEVARRFGCLVIATGERDIVTDGQRTLEVRGGHPLMGQVPGTGCLSAALLGAAVGAADTTLETAAEALLWSALAGERAAASASGPGSFMVAYLDALAAAGDLSGGRIAPPLGERLSLYVLVSGQTPPAVVEAILAEGVGAIQFREKRLPLPKQVQTASRFRELCREAGALFLVNDRVDLALAIGADGVHLGQEDLPADVARPLLGPDAIIGVTCETPEEARAAEAAGADYLGTGPVYATPSKADAGEPYGPAVVERVSAATGLPVVGIGGIDTGRAAPVIAAGGCGVAVISAVVGATDPAAAARSLLAEVRTAKGVGPR